MFDTGNNEHTPQPVNPLWTPVVDIEYLNIKGTDALKTVHRMSYRPGNEMIMGHILLPVQQGLFEGRAIAVDRETGYRESTLMMPILQNLDAIEEIKNIPRPDFEDPIHDSQFPEHCLSRNRSALRWLCNNLCITESLSVQEHGEIELCHLGCFITPPPRFVIDPSVTDSSMTQGFKRVSFCGTDGVEEFIVNCLGKNSFTKSNFPNFVEPLVRQIFHNTGNIYTTTEMLSLHNQQLQLLAVVEESQRRCVILFFYDAHERLWFLNWRASSIVPIEEVVRYLENSMTSLRLINI
jgi:hypothetical protein